MAMSVWIRVLIIFVLLWGFLVFIFASKLSAPNVSDSDYTMKRLNQAIAFMDQSKKRNAELKALIDEYLRYAIVCGYIAAIVSL